MYQTQHYEPKHRIPRVFLPLVIVGLLGFAVAGYLMLRPHGYQPQNPVATQACINAWLKLHDDGLTSQVMEAKDQTVEEVIITQHMNDIGKAMTCGSLNHQDLEYATQQINAQTGDSYTVLKGH